LNGLSEKQNGFSLLLCFGGFRGFRLGGGFGLDWLGSLGWQIHPLEDGAISGIAAPTLGELNDAGVTTVTFFLSRSDFVEQDTHCVLLM